MKVSGGKFKGRRIRSLPKNQETALLRPTTGRVKESVFSILEPYLYGAKFLDLFAGTGNVGIEAISRGADFVVFVESDRRFCNLIKKNLEALGVERHRYRVICKDYIDALKKLAKKREVFDFIYADPPYEKNYYTKVINLVKNLGILDRDGLLILEEPKKAPFTATSGYVVERRHYGTTTVTFVNFGDEDV